MKTSLEADHLRLIYELGRTFSGKIEFDELIPLVVSKCREVLSAEGVAVMLLDEERDELYFPYMSQDDPSIESRLSSIRFAAKSGIAGAVLRSRTAERIDDAQSDPRFYRAVDKTTGVKTTTLLAAPLISGDTVLGVIEAVNHIGGTPFSDDDLVVFTSLADSIAIAIENAHRFGRIKADQQKLQVQVGALRRDLARRESFDEIIATSAAMTEVFRLMESAAASSIAVLIEGETGTGKELVARAIHRASARAEEPFIAVNCAAFTETLLESELFGHRRGAFTGAISDHPGFFKAASGGVIFLDEIGEMPVSMQAKMLRVLEQGEVTAVGDTRPQKIDIRVISATNRDLKSEITEKAFREDLYYRLGAFPIRLPPLRNRRDDIPLLTARFLGEATRRTGKSVKGIEEAAVTALRSYDWPGNVRQLQNEIERAVALVRDGDSLGPPLFSTDIVSSASSAVRNPTRKDPVEAPAGNSATLDPTAPLREARADFEARHIANALARNNGNVSHTATALGISRVALQKKMKELGLRQV